MLQELIASRAVVFVAKEWAFLGAKKHLADLVKITDIERTVLTARFIMVTSAFNMKPQTTVPSLSSSSSSAIRPIISIAT